MNLETRPRRRWFFRRRAATADMPRRASLWPGRGPLRAALDAIALDGHDALPAPAAEADPILRVMTLNLAHGRSDGFHQAFLRSKTILRNLGAVVSVLGREQPDVIALQEADGPCAWSGGFDHVEYLAREAGYAYFVRGEHMTAPRTAYGTAVISRYALRDALSIKFAPSPPTFSKGFVVSSVEHPARRGLTVDIVSVHLDFARASVRRSQIETMIEELRARPNPRVVLGDFNTRFGARERSLDRLAEALKLRVHAPSVDKITFPPTKAHLDWIFASHDLEFIDHDVLPDPLSDHRAVLARLRLP